MPGEGSSLPVANRTTLAETLKNMDAEFVDPMTIRWTIFGPGSRLRTVQICR